MEAENETSIHCRTTEFTFEGHCMIFVSMLWDPRVIGCAPPPLTSFVSSHSPLILLLPSHFFMGTKSGEEVQNVSSASPEASHNGFHGRFNQKRRLWNPQRGESRKAPPSTSPFFLHLRLAIHLHAFLILLRALWLTRLTSRGCLAISPHCDD